MKKRLLTLLLITAILITMLMCYPLTASSATGFEVEDGILTSYSGTSQSVTIPDDVYYIADSAFEGNTKITSVNLNKTAIIGNKAFSNCTSLKTVTGADNVTACGAYAFFNTPFVEGYSSKSLILGNVLVSCGESGDIVIDKSVVSIAPYAFYSNTGVTSVTVGDGVASIGEGAFYNCTALKNISVSSQVSYIGAFAFEGTPYLSSVKDDFLILGKGILVDVNSTSANIVIPENVQQIGAGAFYNNKTVKTVTIPESVTSVGMRAFAGCTALKTADLPESLVHLNDEAFSGCTSLQSTVIPKNVELLGDSVFLGCTALNTAQLLSQADISDGLFASCTSLEYVVLVNGTERIGNYAFYNCKNLSEISVPSSVASVSDTAFKGVDNISVFCKENSLIELFCISKGISAYEIGDANLDGVVNIRDATEVQKACADIITISFNARLRGDADFSGEINVRDATAIQKIIAGIN